ncbi:hypothetical protein PGT21_010196 [Puccinia graminis f. sp. tritici]|uniref:AB hydrolase-1 domain-containing protein n=1 Tax=Puccinia graminis f. sp. tritici TaxID=56615 RepID=A0A5B0QMW2_PUCGR|nr:hypothetical protein PGT21_010196 [Puccinia graminis f. sp. tritici]
MRASASHRIKRLLHRIGVSDAGPRIALSASEKLMRRIGIASISQCDARYFAGDADVIGTHCHAKIDELASPAGNEDLADRDQSKPAASSRDGFLQSHSASPVSPTKARNHPTNVNNTMASSGPIGLQADHVYRSQLSPWRFKIWSILLVTLDKEMPILESIQRSYRSGPLDRLMIFLACSGWSNQVKHFSRKPDHSVLVLDNQGVGNSDAGPLGIYKTSEMAKDTVDLMEYLGWTEEQSVHLFGVSMGGMISQELGNLSHRIASFHCCKVD